MPFKSLPAVSRYAIVVACVAALVAIVTGFIDRMTDNKTKAEVLASQACQEDLKVQIAQLQDYVDTKKAEQAAGDPKDSRVAAALKEKMRVIQAFKSRCRT